jgi:RNA polymerase sigma factor (TIGR02999 family)
MCRRKPGDWSPHVSELSKAGHATLAHFPSRFCRALADYLFLSRNHLGFGTQKSFFLKTKKAKFSKMAINPNNSPDVSQTLEQWCEGDREAASRLMLLVNQELRARASDYFRRERPDQTLQATALVHQAYLKLAIEDQVTSKNRAHFCAVAATLMRRILVQHARDDKGTGRRTTSTDARGIHQEGGPDLIALDEALERFGLSYPRASAVVEMKFFGGMDSREIAEVLNVPEKTVLGDWTFAKDWLSRALMQGAGNRIDRVARVFKSISQSSEEDLAEFVRIPLRG